MKSLLFLLMFIPFIGWSQIQPAACTFNNIPVTATWQDFYDPGGVGGDSCIANQPNNYPNANCITTYRFDAGPGNQVQIHFDYLSMYNTINGWDWMVIRDGGGVNAPILFDNRGALSSDDNGAYYNITGPDNDGTPSDYPDSGCVDFGEMYFCSSNRRLRIEFKATGAISRAGWEAQVRICSALPVELFYFDGDCDHLFWETASESNSSHFTVESTLDGTNWTDIGVNIPAAGNSQEAHLYATEVHSRNYLQYYRLIQHDLNGKTEIFGPISVYCVEYHNEAILEGVYDMMGRRLGNNLNSASSGYYILRFEDGSTERIFHGNE